MGSEGGVYRMNKYVDKSVVYAYVDKSIVYA